MENLVSACRTVVKSFPGGIEAVAAQTGIRSLQQKLNPACDRNKLNADDVDAILQLTRGHEILDVICKRVDAAWIDLSGLTSLACDASMLDNITDLVTKLGALTQSVQVSLADGVVDADEMHELERASLRLISASMTVVRRAEQFMPEAVSA